VICLNAAHWGVGTRVVVAPGGLLHCMMTMPGQSG
jgi:hypothetical protein